MNSSEESKRDEIIRKRYRDWENMDYSEYNNKKDEKQDYSEIPNAGQY